MLRIEHNTDFLSEGVWWQVVCEASADDTTVSVGLCDFATDAFDTCLAGTFLKD